MVVTPADAEDVLTAVRAAIDAGVPVAAFGEGHGFHRGIEGVMIKMSGLGSVEIDREARTAHIGAGATWEQVIEAAQPLGLLPLSGADAGVGVIGYLLGGGFGPLGRTFGYAADTVVEFEVVTGLGDLVTVSDTENADLFWALRGGNTGLGIVVSTTVRLMELTADENLHGIADYYDEHDAERVFREWISVAGASDKRLNTCAHWLRLPPDDPEVPAPLRGRTTLELNHVYVGTKQEAEAATASIRALADPIYVEHGRLRADTSDPIKVNDGGLYLTGVGEEAADVILGHVGPGKDVPFTAVGVYRLGGESALPQGSPNAVAGRTAEYAVHVIAEYPELVDSVLPEKIQEFHAALAPWRAGGTIPNFIGKGNTPGSTAHAWEPDVLERLEAVRAVYDPSGVLRDRYSF
ncbi:FAD-binding oxidoreductase [Streptomyces acidicola]|uniref:FAD-binding oxidoreductase n=1 Tax=Streptomyces acidicola TaxID=2596892 RepID=UPI0038187A81